MPAPLLLDLSHTSHTRARTGVQRVARSLRAALGNAAEPITFDAYLGNWRPLSAWERANLDATTPAAKRGARWPLAARIRSRMARLTRTGAALPPGAAGVLVPEIFSPDVARALPALKAGTNGPAAAVFHDAIALKLPELTPAKTVARFTGYLRELLMFDGIAAISEDSRQTLLDYWRWLGVTQLPPVQTIPLGIDLGRRGAAVVSNEAGEPSRSTGASGSRPVILSVGSIEGRKNHLSLLEACEALWARGLAFELHLIGLAHAETGRSAIERIRALQAAGRPLRYDGPAGDAAVEQAYRASAFTVYPSLMEGFGLPVLESLAHGRPCVCSSRGALGEAAREGGCVALASVDGPALASAIEQLLNNPRQQEELAAAARTRQFRTWTQYAADLSAWLRSLPRRT